ncbi:MAG: 2-oxoacid:acceptor oxidoreductase family protein [Candidatus Hatepunaea meridiana]|nr:2-oxoacid:acceptor oxidoreductase family protein [Candidatus Hatepunaea meridiana]
MKNKMLIAGIGGQGVVYLTNLITEAALLADIPVASSEIHGLSQRRGSVVAVITFGENTYGYIEEAGADYLIGLEPLEAQRCIPYLNRNSRVIIDNNQIFPHSVNAGKTSYPDVTAFADYLQKNIKQVIVNQDFDRELKPILRNTYILGRAVLLDGFPVPEASIEKAVENSAKAGFKDESIRAFLLGRNKSIEQG